MASVLSSGLMAIPINGMKVVTGDYRVKWNMKLTMNGTEKEKMGALTHLLKCFL